MKDKKGKNKTNDLSLVVWGQYANTHTDHKTTETYKYFKKMPPSLKQSFFASDRTIVQFGCSNSVYLDFLKEKAKFNLNREIIGYDLQSILAISGNRAGFTARAIDLNSMENNQLAYEQVLKQDLNQPSDILMIRVLEYLEPEAMQLLLFSVISNSQPGTRIDISIFNSDEEECQDLKKQGFVHSVPQNFIASFFAPRTDIKFLRHNIEEEHSGLAEELVFEKI